MAQGLKSPFRFRLAKKYIDTSYLQSIQLLLLFVCFAWSPLVFVGILWGLRFSPTSQKHEISNTKLPLAVNECGM